MTLDVYSGLFDDDLDGLADRMALADADRLAAFLAELQQSSSRPTVASIRSSIRSSIRVYTRR